MIFMSQRLGWADCRLWQVESAEKFLMVLWLALAFLEFVRNTLHSTLCIADVIRIHRQNHAERLLRQACDTVARTGDIEQVIAHFTLAPAPT